MIARSRLGYSQEHTGSIRCPCANPARTHMSYMLMIFSSGKLLCMKPTCVAHYLCCLQYMSKVEEIISRASTLAQPGEDCRGLFAVVPGNSYQV